MKHKQIYVVRGATEPPTVEVDTEAGAAYIRFKQGKVVKTVAQEDVDAFVTFDLDAQGEVLGVELIGVAEFTIRALLKNLPQLRFDQTDLTARYISAPKRLEPAL